MKNIQFSTQIASQIPGSVPPGFALKDFTIASGKENTPDASAVLQTENKELPIVFEVQNTGGTATLREVARQAKVYGSANGAVPFVAGQFFGERARKVAKEEGVGYVDLAGNFYLKQGDVYVEKIVNKNPYSQKPPLKNLFAPVSSRITRALLLAPQRVWQLNELAQETNVSLGQTYQVVERMQEEELIARNSEGKLILRDPAMLLEEWKKIYPSYQQQKYSFFSYRQQHEVILKDVIEAAQREKLPYALSFFTGADMVAPFIRGLSKVQLYITDVSELAKWKIVLDLQEVESGGNIELYLPYDEGVFYKKQYVKSSGGNTYVVSDVQLYMDLFNNPARGEEQAKYLRETKLKY